MFYKKKNFRKAANEQVYKNYKLSSLLSSFIYLQSEAVLL